MAPILIFRLVVMVICLDESLSDNTNYTESVTAFTVILSVTDPEGDVITSSKKNGGVITSTEENRQMTTTTSECSTYLPLDAPDVVRATDNGTAIFRWTLRNISRYTLVSLQKLRVEIFQYIAISESPNFNIHNTLYSSRVNASLDNNTIIMYMSGINESDSIGTYILELHHTDGKCETENRLYIYRTPKDIDVLIDPPGPHDEGGTITLSCTATSTSVPRDLQLPLVYSWTVGGIDVTKLESARYNVSGSDHSKLTVTEVTPADSDITCTTQEEGSPLSATIETQLKIEESQNNGTEGVMRQGSAIAGFYHIVIAVSAVSGFVALVLAGIVCYLCWERRAHPQRAKNRNRRIRQSIYGRWRPGRDHIESTDSDSLSINQDLYTDIRESDVRTTLDRSVNVPMLPAPRDAGEYAYVDHKALGPRFPTGSANGGVQSGTLRSENDVYHLSKDDDVVTGADLDIYLDGQETTKKPKECSAPSKVTDVYSHVSKPNSSRTGEVEETSLVENETYNPLPPTAPPNTNGSIDTCSVKAPPPGSCRPGNTYVPEPGPRREKSVLSDATTNTKQNDSTANQGPKGTDNSIGTRDRDIYSLAQTLSRDTQATAPATRENLYEFAAQTPEDSTDRDSRRSSKEDAEDELEIVDNEEYVTSP